MGAHVPPPFDIPRGLADDLAKLGSLLDVGRDSTDLGRRVVQEFERKRTLPLDYVTVSYFIFAKCFMTFQTIQTLCRTGCGSDALSLCASLFENCVDLRYIGKAPVLRSRRYMQYEQVEKYHKAQSVLRRKGLPKGRRKKYMEYDKALRPQVAGILRHFPKPQLGWAQKSVRQRAEEVKAGLDYDETYWVYCGHKHTLPMVAQSLVIRHNTGVDLVHGPNIRGVYYAAWHSTDLFLRVCEEFVKVHRFAMSSEVQALTTRLDDAAKQVGRNHPELCQY